MRLLLRQVRRYCSTNSIVGDVDIAIAKEESYKAPSKSATFKPKEWPGHKVTRNLLTSKRIPSILNPIKIQEFISKPIRNNERKQIHKTLAPLSPKAIKYCNSKLIKAKKLHTELVGTGKEYTDDIFHSINFVMPEMSFPKSRAIGRSIIYHAGNPHAHRHVCAFAALWKAKRGLYVSNDPIQVEQVWQSLLQSGVPCNLITSTTRTMHPDATHTCCTLGEICFQTVVDCAVIEDGDMASHETEGWRWTFPILGIACSTLHVLGDTAGEPVIKNLSEACGGPYFSKYYPLSKGADPYWKIKKIAPKSDSPFSLLCDEILKADDVIAIDDLSQLPDLNHFIRRRITAVSEKLPLEVIVALLSRKHPGSVLVIEKSILSRNVLNVNIAKLYIATPSPASNPTLNRKIAGRTRNIIATPEVAAEISASPKAKFTAGISPLKSHLEGLEKGVYDKVIPAKGLNKTTCTLYDYFNRWAMVDENRYFICKIPNLELVNIFNQSLCNIIGSRDFWTLAHMSDVVKHKKYFSDCVDSMLSGDVVNAVPWNDKEDPTVLLTRMGECLLYASLASLHPNSFVDREVSIIRARQYLKETVNVLDTRKKALPTTNMGLLGNKLSSVEG